jgi:diguanylate cyclase (GGDEF)-like protein
VNPRLRTRLVIGGSIVVIAAAVWIVGQAARDSSREGADAIEASNDLLTARLDMETGLRGFFLTGEEEFLDPYIAGRQEYDRALQRARDRSDGEDADRLLAEQDSLTDRWIALAESGIARRRAGLEQKPASLQQRKERMDAFREANTEFEQAAEQLRDDRQGSAVRLELAVIAGLGLLGAIIGYLVVERPAGRVSRWRRGHAEFSETLQFARDEEEAHQLLKRRLERVAPGATAAVLISNNSENRLRSATELDPDSPLAQRLPTAAPPSCLAIRRGQEHRRGPEEESLLECELCSDRGSSSICMPALVGGEVIGSVLVGGGARIDSVQRHQLEETVSIAAPVLGNLRNLAIAETRAVTDSLTGLANSRSAADTVQRMAAFAGRSLTPLTAILLDLDHFKRINDNFGHQVGDEVLAAVGRELSRGVRASDFTARYGGEEFLILLQATRAEDGVELAEKLRTSLEGVHVPGYTGRVTASFGVAAMPDHAGDADSLLRAADQALYAAKEAGRNRVIAAGGSPAPQPQPADPQSSRA